MRDEGLPFCETEHGEFVPLLLYRNRWAVEVSFFELKSFWSLENYMVRHASGLDMLLNLIVLTYSLAKLLPWIDPDFAAWQGQSAQEIRRRLGRLIWAAYFYIVWSAPSKPKIIRPVWRKPLPGGLGHIPNCSNLVKY